MYKNDIIRRTLQVAQFVRDTNATVRTAAKVFGTSKSTVHQDLRKRLPKFCTKGKEGFSEQLLEQVNSVIENNKAQRHLRGGNATKERYAKIKSAK